MIKLLLFFTLPLFFLHTADPTGDDPRTTYYVDSSTWQIRSAATGNAEKIALITIDDGPKAYTTPKFLDLLDRYNAKALFFINGYLAEPLPWVVKGILERGHMLGNHTWGHENLNHLTPGETERQITKLNQWMETTLGYRPDFFRAPYGVNTDASNTVMERTGMKPINWSVLSYDWLYTDDTDSLQANAAEIARRTLRSMENGNILLLHDRAVSVAALEIILEELTQQGYRFVLPSGVDSPGLETVHLDPSEIPVEPVAPAQLSPDGRPGVAGRW
ncbi:MAG: polysaccharide deacetylase family protein [Bacteroidetes bacterium]|jgi:peptidoglycan/xylan/chitin deacetylase (PgdA/CDA1 family)|nr:polysaccharide deacetylase family protein [Bacteroidota bacterium]